MRRGYDTLALVRHIRFRLDTLGLVYRIRGKSGGGKIGGYQANKTLDQAQNKRCVCVCVCVCVCAERCVCVCAFV